MFNWFGSKKKDIADLESIEIAPEITIPEKTRRELFDLAVAEVQQLRVKELIKRELRDICLDQDVLADNLAAIARHKTDIIRTHREYERLISEFPKMHTVATGALEYDEDADQYSDFHHHGMYPVRKIQDPEVSLDAFADRLAAQYMAD